MLYRISDSHDSADAAYHLIVTMQPNTLLSTQGVSVGPQKRKRLKLGERVTLSLMLAQVDLLTEDATIGEHLLALLYAARVYDNVVRIRCTLGDLGQLSKYVADEANDTKDKIRQQRLDEIFEAIRTFEQSYYGASLRIVSTRPSAMRTGLEDP